MTDTFFIRGIWLAVLWQSTAWLLVGLAASFLLRRNPARAHATLVVTLVGLMLTPLAHSTVAFLGMGLLEPVESRPHRNSSPVQSTVAHEDDAVLTALETTDASVAIDDSNSMLAQSVIDAPTPVAMSRAAMLPRLAQLPWGVWTVLSLILGTRILVATMKARGLVARQGVVTDPRLVKCLDQAATCLGLGGVPLLGSAEIHSPLIWCWGRRPTVLVPSHAGKCVDGVDWVGIFRHELAHWKRGDHLTELLARIAA
ncbi:MAG TPA: M56 family metallopeptidase, partial [Pirellulaceae bacterium]|nr:M56 family metallopeptidase [Pirellulaceae bacterium]